MNQKLISLSLVVLALCAVLNAATLDRRPDFLIEDDSGKVIKRGIYTTGSNGEVLRYDIISEDTKAIIHSEVPVYDTSGKIALVRVFGNDGSMKLIIVMTESGPVTLDPAGKVLDEEQSHAIYRSDYIRD